MARNDYSSTAKAANDYSSSSVRHLKGEAKNAASEAADYLEDTKDSALRKARSITDEAVLSVHKAADEASEALMQLAESAREVAAQGYDKVSRKVVERPFTSLALAAGIGLLLGFISRPR